MRSYNATIVRGRLQEHLISQSEPIDESLPEDTLSTPWAITDTHCISPVERIKLEKRGFAINSSRWLRYNLTNQQNSWRVDYDALALSLLQHGCLYVIGAGMADFMTSWLQNSINGTVQTNEWFVESRATDVHDFAKFSGPPILRLLYANTTMDIESIKETLANISQSATD